MTEEMMEEIEEVVFGIVGHAGEAKGLAHEALKLSEEGKIEAANNLMKECDQAILKAHYIQTDLIQKEAAGDRMPISMLFVHAQDHLMGALSEKELIKKMIIQNSRLINLENKLETLIKK